MVTNPSWPEWVNVPRETFLLLERYESLLREWQPTINLVSPADLPELRNRHLVDCLQLHSLLPPQAEVLDMGSGAGLPGLVLAICGHRVTLIESDQRKAAFLRHVIGSLGLPGATVHARRIEEVNRQAPFVTARALASLSDLLSLAAPKLSPGGSCIFPKGKNCDMEIESALRKWVFEVESHPSRTQEDGKLLIIKNIKPAGTPK
jgi:16S rRNA (guanine527-N7)-methyltransferase